MTFIPAYSAVRDDVEDAILSNPSNTNLPTFVSRDEAVSELPVGALFRSAEGANSERLYLRASEAPGYQDQGDNYALLTAAQFGNVDNTADADKPVSGPQAAALAEKPGGVLIDGEWLLLPAIPIIDLSGDGTVTIDTRDAAGVITAAVAVFNPPTDTSDWLLISGAVEARAAYTGTASARIR